MKKIINDIADFLYLRNIIKKASKEKMWGDLTLRHDWFYNPYTVINLPPEAFSADRDAQLQYIAYSMQDINAYFTEHLLDDMLEPSVEPIEGTASYLIVYHQTYETLGTWFFVKVLFGISLAAYVLMKYDSWKIWHKIVELAKIVTN